MKPLRLKPFLVTLWCLAWALFGFACIPMRPGESPERATARSAVLTVAHAVKAADAACARVEYWQLSKTERLKILTTCAQAHDTARLALLGAEASLDAWKAGADEVVACAAAKSTEALLLFAKTLRAAGVAMPAALEDGIAIANGFVSLAGKAVCK